MTMRMWMIAVAVAALAVMTHIWVLECIRHRRSGTPPPVRGKVSWADLQNQWVVLTLGHDDGIRPGHELNVIRGNPQAKSLGRIRIIAVDYDQAIGRVIQETIPGIRIQPGDLVTAESTAEGGKAGG
jgi:hypothetical protein